MVRYEDPAFQASMKIKLDVSNMMQEVLGEKGFTAVSYTHLHIDS